MRSDRLLAQWKLSWMIGSCIATETKFTGMQVEICMPYEYYSLSPRLGALRIHGEAWWIHGEAWRSLGALRVHGESMVKQGLSHVQWFSGGDWKIHKRFKELILLYHISCLKTKVIMLLGLSPHRERHFKESGFHLSILLLISRDLGFGASIFESGFKVLNDYNQMLIWA